MLRHICDWHAADKTHWTMRRNWSRTYMDCSGLRSVYCEEQIIKIPHTRPGTEESTSIRLKYPEPPIYGSTTAIRRGDLVTVSLVIPCNQLGTHVSVKCVEIPITLVEPEIRLCRLIFNMELWAVPRPYDFFLDTTSSYDPALVTETRACRCAVRLHGKYSVIKEGVVEICFEFPRVCKKHWEFEYVNVHILLPEHSKMIFDVQSNDQIDINIWATGFC